MRRDRPVPVQVGGHGPRPVHAQQPSTRLRALLLLLPHADPRTCKENTLTHFLGLIVGPNVEGQLARYDENLVVDFHI